MKQSIVLPPEVRELDRAVSWIERAEQLGFHSAMLGCGHNMDPLVVFAVAAGRTECVLLTTNVLPTYTRHPLVTAMQALTTQAAADGRLRLGLGPGHASIIEDCFGLPFDRLIRHTSEYFQILRQVFDGKHAKFEGELFRVDWEIDVESPPIPLFLSSLGEQMCRAAGRHADGVLPWLAPPAYVRDTIVPTLRESAEKAGRPVPPVVMIMPCILSTNREEVRAGVHAYLDLYPRLEAYAALLERCGVPDAKNGPRDGWTDAMIDAVVPHGDQEALAAALARYREAGVDEMAFLPVGVGDDPQASVERTWAALAELV
ncbi:MAG: LLM class flavin-dependent oxidoreductase [bacterium]|nr:LLM class flavin-dependent oxidoreductase [bacterium]